MTVLPDFVVACPPRSDPQSPAPYRFEDVGVQLFVVPADGARLQATCDWFLNDVARERGSPLRIDPLVGLGRGIVNVQVLRYPRIYSAAPGHEQLGYVSQNELFFSIPVVLSSHGVPRAVGLFTPFLCVDNANSLITGREVVGYAKVYGNFTLPDGISNVDGTKVETLATETLSRNTKIEDCVIFESNLSGAGYLLPDDSALHDAIVDADMPGTLKKRFASSLWPFGPLDELYGPDSEFAVGSRTMALLNRSAGVTAKSYTLKQFRDAQAPDKACYQALVEGTMKVYEFHAGGVLPNADLSLHKYVNINLIDHLGLEATGSKVKPLYGLWYRAGFILEDLDNLLVSCGWADGRGHRPHDCVNLMMSSTAAALRFYRGLALAMLRVLDPHERGRDPH